MFNPTGVIPAFLYLSFAEIKYMKYLHGDRKTVKNVITLLLNAKTTYKGCSEVFEAFISFHSHNNRLQ